MHENLILDLKAAKKKLHKLYYVFSVYNEPFCQTKEVKEGDELKADRALFIGSDPGYKGWHCQFKVGDVIYTGVSKDEQLIDSAQFGFVHNSDLIKRACENMLLSMMYISAALRVLFRNHYGTSYSDSDDTMVLKLKAKGKLHFESFTINVNQIDTQGKREVFFNELVSLRDSLDDIESNYNEVVSALELSICYITDALSFLSIEFNKSF